MAFLDHEGGAEFPYPQKDVFAALRHAAAKLDGFELESADPLSGRVVVKTGISLRTLGERIPISLSEIAPERTRVSVSSSARVGPLGGVFDWGKNKENIERILAQLSLELRHAHPASRAASAAAQKPRVAAGDHGSDNLAARLLRLKTLLDQNLITQVDFDERKAEILREI